MLHAAILTKERLRGKALNWRAFGARKPTPPATPFSRHSTVRRERYAARSPSYSRSGNSVFKRGPECITGECELMGDNVGGIAVHSGARIMAKAKPGAMLVSGTVKDLVSGSGIDFQDHGVHQLKGVLGEWRLFAARS